MTVTPYKIALTDAQKTVKFSVGSCPLACVFCSFLMRLMRSLSGDIPFVRSYPLASLGHVQNFERTPPDKDVRCMNVTRALVWGLFGSRAACTVRMRSASVGILYVSID